MFPVPGPLGEALGRAGAGATCGPSARVARASLGPQVSRSRGAPAPLSRP